MFLPNVVQIGWKVFVYSADMSFFIQKILEIQFSTILENNNNSSVGWFQGSISMTMTIFFQKKWTNTEPNVIYGVKFGLF